MKMSLIHKSILSSGALSALVWASYAAAKTTPASIPATGAEADTVMAPAGPARQLAPSGATATDKPSATPSNQLQEVVVTAQRRSESLSRVGETVTAVGSADLQRQGITSPEDLSKVVPGFQATTSYGGSPVYTLRGVGFNTQNVNATAPVGIYIDEAALPYPYMSNGVLFDIQRVEVLKGPQGTLYGRNATGGLVDFVTQKPTTRFSAGGSVELGNYATVNADAYVSGPVSDWLRLRLAVASTNRFDGWQHSVSRDETLGVQHRNSLRLTADVGNGGPFTAEVTATYWSDRSDTVAGQVDDFRPAGSPFVLPAALASVVNYTSDTQADWLSKSRQPQADIGIIHEAPIVRSDFASLNTKLSYALTPELKVVSLTSYNYLNHRDVSDAAGLQTEDIYQDSRGYEASASEELRLVGDYGRLNWSVGAYYAYDNTAEDELGYADENVTIATLRYVASTIPQTLYSPQQIARSFGNFRDTGDTNVNVAAGFANAEYKFNDKFKLSVGGRYTYDETKFKGCTYDVQGGNVAVVNLVYPIFFGHPFDLTSGHCYTVTADSSNFIDLINEKQEETNFAWRAVLDYTPNNATLIYGSISRGYKAGGFPVLAGNNIVQYNPVDQEELTAFEAGAKLSLFDRHVQLNASTFYYDYKNKQVYGFVQDVVFGTLSRIENVPKSSEIGVEGDITWRIIPELIANIAGTYLDSRIDNYMGFDNLGNPVDFKGRPFAYTPKYQGNAGLVYDAPLTPSLRSIASVNLSYQDTTSADFAGLPQFKLKSYALLDATLGVASPAEGWRAALFVRNLLNTYYWTGVGTTTDTVFRYPGMPRTFGVRLSHAY